MKLNAQITQLETELATARQDLATRTSERDTAISERDGARADLTTATTERDTARTELADVRGQLTTVTGERDQARQELQTEREGSQAKIDAGIRQGIAAAGVPPVRRVDTPDPANPKADKSGSPRERLAASFNAQFEKK